MSLRSITVRILRFQYRNKRELNDSYSVDRSKNTQNPLIEDINLKANIFSFISMEILFYPVETIIHRLHIQVWQVFKLISDKYCLCLFINKINIMLFKYPYPKFRKHNGP